MGALTGGWTSAGEDGALFRWTGADPDPRVAGLFAWLPPGARSGDRVAPSGYPVLYWLDGAAVHESGPLSMSIPQTLARLADRGIEVIAVGLGSSASRFHDYSPSALVRVDGCRGGGVASFARLVVDIVVPLIDTTLPTRASADARTIVGESIGAVAALHVAIAHPQTFGSVIAHSPSLWATAGVTHRAVRRSARAGLPGGRMWIDAGDREVPDSVRWSAIYRRQAERLAATARRRLGAARVGSAIEIGGRHGNEAWGRRLPDALRFVLTESRAEPPAADGRVG